MTVEPSRQFSRDVRRLGSSQIRRRLDWTIQELIEAADITEVSGVRQLLAEGQNYRIRIGDYRLGITMDGETAVLRRFLPRGEIYRYFSVRAGKPGGVCWSGRSRLSAASWRSGTLNTASARAFDDWAVRV